MKIRTMRERNMEKYFIHRRDNVELKFLYIYIYVCCARLPNLVVDDTLTCEIWKSNFQTYC